MTIAGNPDSPYPFPSNPWLGADRRLVIHLRKTIDGPIRFPDAPPPSIAQMSAMERAWVADIAEGYRAVYATADAGLVVVSAIRFNDGKLPATTPPAISTSTSSRVTDRLIVRNAVVLLQVDAITECSHAVAAHIRTLR